MIRIQAVGGLGNQLFIWNLAHFLEDLYNCKVYIYNYNPSDSKTKSEIQCLDDFCGHRIYVVASNKLNRFLVVIDKLANRSVLLQKLINRVFRIMHSKVPSEVFDLGTRKPRIVRGYFQDPKFVESNSHLYIEELLEYTRNIANSSEIFAQIKNNSQVFHVRRGDFITNWEKVGLLTTDYFKSLINPKKKSIVFTDANFNDLEVVKSFKDAQIIGSTIADTWTAFSLMSFSQNLILSNSTFSWWAGYLAVHRGGIVKAPTPWTRTSIYGANYLEYSGFLKSPAKFLGDTL